LHMLYGSVDRHRKSEHKHTVTTLYFKLHMNG